jgi:hypothetical protein
MLFQADYQLGIAGLRLAEHAACLARQAGPGPRM